MRRLRPDELDWLGSLENSVLTDYLRTFPQEIAKRILAQLANWAYLQDPRASESSLHAFVQAAWPYVEPRYDFVDGRHIRLICAELERLTATPDADLLINVPPGCSKSIIVCVLWPCWVWGPLAMPETKWVFASYSQELTVQDQSVTRRNLMLSPWYQQRWGGRFRFADDVDRKTRYRNSRGGEMFSTSVGGGGLGMHPDFFVIDDPHKTKEVSSDAERQVALDWYRETVVMRGRMRKSRRATIMQRLHEEDLSNLLIETTPRLRHICLPMRYESDHPYRCPQDWRTVEGELLWPEGFDENYVSAFETKHWAGTLWAASQFQQRPVPAGGNIIKREWFIGKFGLTPPQPHEFEAVIRAWDTASSESDSADYTVGVLLGKRGMQLWVLDVVRGKWKWSERDGIILSTAKMDAAKYGSTMKVWLEREGGSGGKDQVEYLVSLLTGFAVDYELASARGTKVVGADPFASQCSAGNVYLADGEWTGEFLSEILAFPSGKYDDQVDAVALAVRKINAGSDQTSLWLRMQPSKIEVDAGLRDRLLSAFGRQ